MKKTLFVLTLFLVVVFAGPAAAVSSDDVLPKGHWIYEGMGWFQAKGVIGYYSDCPGVHWRPRTRYSSAKEIKNFLDSKELPFSLAKFSVRDISIFQALILEFHNELEALGVDTTEVERQINEQNLLRVIDFLSPKSKDITP